jgi:hypothetical protein
LVKRTRRNLSDPRIKKILKAQTINGHIAVKKLPHPRKRFISRDKVLKGFFFLAAASAMILAIYFSWADINRFLNETLRENISISSLETPQEADVKPGLSQMPLSSAQPSAEQETTTPDENDTGTENPPAETKLPAVARRIQVEVLNGCGIKGLAEKLTDYLREQNIDVVSRGNYSSFTVKRTMIFDRIDNNERTGELAAVLGIDEEQVQVKKDNNLQLDATIVLGADYKKLKPFTN